MNRRAAAQRGDMRACGSGQIRRPLARDCTRAAVLGRAPRAALVIAVLAVPASAALPALNLTWDAQHRRMAFDFRGQRRTYPDDVDAARFPQPGDPFKVEVETDWPVVTLRARWSMAADRWPSAYRGNAIDLILMRACDAGAYARLYPDAISEARFTAPPEFLREATSPAEYHLARELRGRKLPYEVTGRGGFGAADYTIRTEMRIGLSADERTAFYHDHPTLISDHLVERDYLFMARDAGDRFLFEVHAVCVCAPRTLFQGEALRRVRRDGEYLITKMFEQLRSAPQVKEIEDFFTDMRRRARRAAMDEERR